MMRHAVSRHKGRFECPSPPESPGAETVLDTVGAKSLIDHTRRVDRPAWSVWLAWAEYHTATEPWIDRLQT